MDEAASEPDYLGVVIIEWPAPPAHGVGALPGWGVAVFDAFTGSSPGPKPITTVSRMVIRADAQEIVTAELTMFADEDGKPILDGPPVLKGKEIITGTFPFIVAEMRVAK